MADERKRIIEQTASTEIFDDDWFIKDSALHNTTKISQTVLKQEILKDVKGVVELTQAEYDALPSSKLTDGILYAIKDSEDIIGNIENAINTLSGDVDDLEELVSTEMYNTAPMWSGSSYTFDDLVVYDIDGRLYRCIVRNSTANQFVSSEWQATDIKAELYLLLQRIAPQFIASSQSYTQVYYKGNLVLHTNDYGVNTFFVCKQDLPQGDTEWVANHWEEVNTVSGLSKYLMDKIAEAGQIDDVQVKTTGDYESVVDENKVAKIDLSNVMIEKSVPNLPQPIASFSDGAEDLPLKSLTASIVPVQDLHGYDSPWAGGAGKNKFDDSDYTSSTYSKSGHFFTNTQSDTRTFFAFTLKDEQDATLTQSNITSTGLFVSNSFTTSTTNSQLIIKHNGATKDLSINFTESLPAGTYKIVMTVNGANPSTNGGLSFGNIMIINANESDTSYAPYSNICPISGWTEEVITRTGKNFLPLTVKNLRANNIDGTWNGNTYTLNSVAFTVNTNESGKVTGIKASGIATNNTYFILDNNFDSTKYTGWIINGLPSNGGSGSFLFRVASQDSWSSLADYQTGTGNVLIDSGSGKRLGLRISNGYQANDVMFYPMIRQSSESAEFEPFGTSYTIPFTDGQGQSVEVFGGSVDVVNGGEQPNPYGVAVLDGSNDEAWSADPDVTSTDGYVCFRAYLQNNNIKKPEGSAASISYIGKMFSNTMPTLKNGYGQFPMENIEIGITGYSGASNNYYYIIVNKTLSNIQSVADLRAWLAEHPTQVRYELATPTTFYTQPTSIKSLDGDNNVFASTGDVTKLEYIANATDVIANLEARVTALENQ